MSAADLTAAPATASNGSVTFRFSVEPAFVILLPKFFSFFSAFSALVANVLQPEPALFSSVSRLFSLPSVNVISRCSALYSDVDMSPRSSASAACFCACFRSFSFCRVASTDSVRMSNFCFANSALPGSIFIARSTCPSSRCSLLAELVALSIAEPSSAASAPIRMTMPATYDLAIQSPLYLKLSQSACFARRRTGSFLSLPG